MPQSDRTRRRRTILLAAVLFLAPVVSAETVRYLTGAEAARAAANPSWIEPQFDDSGWTSGSFDDLPHDATHVLVRKEVVFRGIPRRPVGVFFGALASHEIYWDGLLIGRGGKVSATAEGETPGPIQSVLFVPPHLITPGRHVIAVRSSAHHRGFAPRRPWWVLHAGDYESMVRSPFWRTFAAVASFSGLVIGGVFALILFVTNRRDVPSLLLCAMCTVAATLLVAESWRDLFGYTYDWHIVRLVAITALSWMLNSILVCFMAARFPFKRSLTCAIVSSLALAVPAFVLPYWDMKTLVMFVIGFGVSIAWALSGVIRRQRAAFPALAALIFSAGLLAYSPFAFADGLLFVALDLLVICLLSSHAFDSRRDRLAREAATLRSARLEAELLRRQIQPHFLMNTLTALTEWIERDPAAAVEMIEAFAGELRLLGEMSSRQLVPLGDELRLCELHLEVMSRRTNRRYSISAEAQRLDVMVPPAVIHTIVENAVTHAPAGVGEIAIHVQQNTSGERVRFVVDAPLGGSRHKGSGTGLRYIASRLQESFGRDWKLLSKPVAGVWRTEIDVPLRTVTAAGVA